MLGVAESDSLGVQDSDVMVGNTDVKGGEFRCYRGGDLDARGGGFQMLGLGNSDAGCGGNRCEGWGILRFKL